jgi:rsbT co-antagonist protein RsbR
MSRILELLRERESELLDEWVQELKSSGGAREDLMRETELREQCRQFLSLLRAGAQTGNLKNIMAPEWRELRELLTGISRARVVQGFTPSDVATFVFSFRKPLLARLQRQLSGDVSALMEEVGNVTTLFDRLGIWTSEVYQKAREEVIARQQEELLELSTPVVKLWEGVLALPMIGTLDSARTQVVMETLLQRIVETGSEIAIIDITGVPTVDTLVAQHLLKTVAAARLMGADCIISGIRPQIAQTIVHLAIDLREVTTKASLADAFVLALRRTGYTISRAAD